MKRKYIFLGNPFDNATKESKVKMLLLSNDHDTRLEAASDDPDIAAIYAITNPEVVIYRALMAKWSSSKGMGKGRTMSWEGMLDEISEKYIYQWEGKVFAVYPKNTPEAMAIFPNNKAPFISGKYEERLLALDALSITLGEYPLLSDLKKEVDRNIVDIKATRKDQKLQFGKISMRSNEVELQRKVMADLMDDNMCKLKIKYRKNMDMVENFFDLSLLRKNVNDTDSMFQFSGTVEAASTYVVPLPEKLTLSTKAVCTFSNQSGFVEFQFFFAANGANLDNPVKTSVLANMTAEGTVAESGWAPGMNFIIVKNVGTVSAEFDLTVVAVSEASE